MNEKNPKNEVSLFLNKLLTDVQSFRFCWSYNVYICERFNKIRQNKFKAEGKMSTYSRFPQTSETLWSLFDILLLPSSWAIQYNV